MKKLKNASVHSRLSLKYVHKSGGKRLGLVKETLQNTPCSQVPVRSIVQGFFASVVALLTKETTNQTESQQIKPNQKGKKSLRTEKRTNKISACMTAGQEI